WHQAIQSQSSTPWCLAVAGWDQRGHEHELKALATELGIAWADLREFSSLKSQTAEASLLFLGPQFGDNKAACYRHSDAFILPSFSEGLPMVILEAWAFTKPVLMTAECNLSEGFAEDAALSIQPSVSGILAGL